MRMFRAKQDMAIYEKTPNPVFVFVGAVFVVDSTRELRLPDDVSHNEWIDWYAEVERIDFKQIMSYT